MADCDIMLNGIARDCQLSRGGILHVYLAPRNLIGSITVGSGVDENVISAITPRTGVVTPIFKEYQVQPFTSNFESTVTPDITTGSTSIETTITLQFVRMTPEKNLEIQQLFFNGFVALIQDANREWWYFGYDEQMYIGDGTQAQTGTERTDLNGYTLVLLDYSDHLPYGVTTDAAESVISESTGGTPGGGVNRASVKSAETKADTK